MPNARLDCWFIFEGALNIWDESKKCFCTAPVNGGYPATNSSLLFHIPKKLSCINIKLYLNSLTIPFFRYLYPANPFLNLSKCYNHTLQINQKNVYTQGSLNIKYLDKWALQLISTAQSDITIESLVEIIHKQKIISVKELSAESNLSSRNLQRVTKKAFNLSPKELLTVFRFSQTTSYLKANPQKAFIDALSFGYYDQSHFIRECRRISGSPPKELFSNMTFSTSDLMILD